MIHAYLKPPKSTVEKMPVPSLRATVASCTSPTVPPPPAVLPFTAWMPGRSTRAAVATGRWVSPSSHGCGRRFAQVPKVKAWVADCIAVQPQHLCLASDGVSVANLNVYPRVIAHSVPCVGFGQTPSCL